MYVNIKLRRVRVVTPALEIIIIIIIVIIIVLHILRALGIQLVMRVRRIVICGLSGSTIFFHIIS
jgi:hypothetical protein